MDWTFIPALLAGAGIAEVTSYVRDRRSARQEAWKWQRDQVAEACARLHGAAIAQFSEISLAERRGQRPSHEEFADTNAIKTFDEAMARLAIIGGADLGARAIGLSKALARYGIEVTDGRDTAEAQEDARAAMREFLAATTDFLQISR